MTSGKIRTVVAFRSDAFNTTDPKDYFINDCCFGDDVGKWLIGELRSRGIDVDSEPDQEDWGWCVTCRVDGHEHTLGVGVRPVIQTATQANGCVSSNGGLVSSAGCAVNERTTWQRSCRTRSITC